MPSARRRSMKSRSRQDRGWFICLLVILTFVAVNRFSQRSSTASSHLRGVSIRDVISLSKFPPSTDELAKINARLTDSDDILSWAYEALQQGGSGLRGRQHKMAQVTSFGPTGLVILHKLHTLGFLKAVPVITIDTLHLFPESYSFYTTIQKHYPDMNLLIYQPQTFHSRKDFDDTRGRNFWKTDPDRYAQVTKVEPMMRGLEEHSVEAWITGRRRSQGGERSKLDAVEVDPYNSQRLKINPLAHWTYDQVWDYIHQHNIPYNPLYDDGYKSLGDTMTTQRVEEGAEERSGRFQGLNKTECGMHAHLEKLQKMRQKAEQEDKKFVMPTLPCEDCLEVDTTNFDNLVVKGNAEMLLEFYSPMCLGCQEFSPQYNKIASKLLSYYPKLQVARFDITENDVPGEFEVEATPSLFLVTRNPFRTLEYGGDHDIKSVLRWLKENSEVYQG